MHHRESRSAIYGSTALKLDAGLSSAHIIQFPGTGQSSRQITEISPSNHALIQCRAENDAEGHSGSQRFGQTEPKATPSQTALIIILLTLLTIIAGII